MNATMPPERKSALNKRLIKLRTTMGLTQTAMAERLRVNLRTYQRWESTARFTDLPGPLQIAIEFLEKTEG